MGGKGSKTLKIPPGVDLSIRQGNPHYGSRMRLFSKTNFHISINSNGKVYGINEDTSNDSVMEFTSNEPTEVRIRAVHSNLYLAMNRNGKLYGEINPLEEGTIFIETFFGSYNTYLSKKFAHKGWYVGIKKNGKPKNGKRTKWGQKAIQFLPIRCPPPPQA